MNQYKTSHLNLKVTSSANLNQSRNDNETTYLVTETTVEMDNSKIEESSNAFLVGNRIMLKGANRNRLDSSKNYFGTSDISKMDQT